MEKRLKVLISENGADFVREYVPALEEAGMTCYCQAKLGQFWQIIFPHNC